MSDQDFRIRRITAKERGTEYQTFQLVGYLNGERIRKRFKRREDAVFEKSRLEVQAANSAGEMRAVNTRLSSAQVAEAETAFRRLSGKSLSDAVDWYLANYQPPSTAKLLTEASVEYLDYKRPHVEAVHLDDLKRKLAMLGQWYPRALVETITAVDLESRMGAKGWANKTWNNVRAAFHDFFGFAVAEPRRWRVDNPAARIAPRKVARGLPAIENAERIKQLFEFLEGYAGGPRMRHEPGFLVPYFALATFAGLRPSVPRGEIWKIGRLRDLSRTVDTAMGVIRISPDIAKTDFVRQIKIRPNLAAWLAKYPLDRFPIVMPNLQHHVTITRMKFALSADVLRHTWISAHVAAFKSLGEAAIEAGNSESIIRRHYLNLMSDEEAGAFWSVSPSTPLRPLGAAQLM